MTSEKENDKKCFTFVWKIENASYFWQKLEKHIDSPHFVVNEIEGIKWVLRLYPVFNEIVSVANCLTFALIKVPTKKNEEIIKIEWQIDLLASNHTVLISSDRNQSDIGATEDLDVYSDIIPGRTDVFDKRRSEFLPQDTLTVRCNIWKKESEFSENIRWIARSCIKIQERSFLWEVGHFSAIEPQKKHTYLIKSFVTDEQLLSLDLFLNAESNSEEIQFIVTPIDEEIKTCNLELSPIDASGNTYDCQNDKFQFEVPGESKESSLRLPKSEMMGKNKVLAIWCVCGFSAGTIIEEIERISISTITFEDSKKKNRCLDSENTLIDDFKSLLNDNILSDVSLKTNNKIYPAHKCILGSRSPVFKAMFSSDMKERIKDRIDIEDLSGDTVSRMLRYIYSAEVEELDWNSAIELYEAADKYAILTLMDICSSYLKNNLSRDNACETLILADLHKDENLKGFVQDFILKQGKTIILSEEWEHLMENNLKLAAETMRLKYKG